MADVGKPSYLVKRAGSGSWYYRRRYPDDVVGQLGDAFMRSLKTGNRAEALKRLPGTEIAYHHEIALARAAAGGSIRRVAHYPERPTDHRLAELNASDAVRLARLHFVRLKAALDRETPLSPRSDEWRIESEEIERLIAILRSPDERDLWEFTGAAENLLLSEAGLRAEVASEASITLRDNLRRSLLQIAKLRRAKLLDDDNREVIIDTLFVPAACNGLRDGKSMSELFRLYKAEHLKGRQLKAKSVAKGEASLEIIGRFFGQETAVAAITRDDCYRFRDTLGKLPPNSTKTFGKEIDLNEVAVRNAAASGPVLDWRTQDGYLKTLRSMFELAHDRGWVTANVAVRVKPLGRPRPKEELRQAFSHAQLLKIFEAPIYRGCKDDEEGYATIGPNIIRRSRFWVPLIALFSGLRLGEILQLTSGHIRLDEDGHPYFAITREMIVKTRNSYRCVPVHPELVRIGLMRLVKQAARSESKLLFDDVPVGSDGTRSSVFSKRFRTFLQSRHLEEAERKVAFHSFRHSFRDKLRRADVNADLVDELMGHSRGARTGTSYGDGAPPRQMRPLVNSIDYDLDLAHLHLD